MTAPALYQILVVKRGLQESPEKSLECLLWFIMRDLGEAVILSKEQLGYRVASLDRTTKTQRVQSPPVLLKYHHSWWATRARRACQSLHSPPASAGVRLCTEPQQCSGSSWPCSARYLQMVATLIPLACGWQAARFHASKCGVPRARYARPNPQTAWLQTPWLVCLTFSQHGFCRQLLHAQRARCRGWRAVVHWVLDTASLPNWAEPWNTCNNKSYKYSTCNHKSIDKKDPAACDTSGRLDHQDKPPTTRI